MLGAIVFKLRAENASELPMINGRLMHAAFFSLIRTIDPALEQSLHSQSTVKPFTVSFLEPIGAARSDHNAWSVRRHDEFIWRITVLNDEILRAVLSLNPDHSIVVGGLTLSIDDVITDGRRDCGVISKSEFIEGVRSSAPPTEITFRFAGPTTFRIDDFDAPYPRADLIFASLVDKWTQSRMPASADKQLIRELSTRIRLTTWSGRSKKIFFGRDRGTLAFWGEFVFNLEPLPSDARKVFLLMARFAEYAGVGRLTAQGFGQTRVFST